jgi:UDP-N-acetylglucosamine acyltransferase
MPTDPSAIVAPTARVHPDAVIGPGCVIGDFCVIESDVAMGSGCHLEPYVFVKRWTRLGDENRISAGACLGTDPFDKAFTGERSYLEIGDRNIIREHFTISRGTKPESTTTIGNDNYIMGSGHIAHNARIGNSCVIASCALLAGYVEVEDQAFISGGVAIHQFSRIGRLAMVGGKVRVNRDCPPYFLYSGLYNEPVGLNRVGLRRAGISIADIGELKQAYRTLYSSGLKMEEALTRIEATLSSPHARHLAAFIRSCKRPVSRPGRKRRIDVEDGE